MKNITVVLVVIIFLGFGYYAFNQGGEEMDVTNNTQPISAESLDAETPDSDTTDNESDSMNAENSDNIDNTTELDSEIEIVAETSLAAGTYEVYTSEKVSTSGDNNVVLFFKADWCPSCRALDSDIKSNLSEIPSDVIILEVNYDTETELKKKYGVTTQHTLVQVNSNGDLVQKWSGGNRLETVISKIN